MGTSPGGEEVREVEFQGVRFGHNFLGIEVVEEFQFWQIITQDGFLDFTGEVGDPMVDRWSRQGSNGGFWGGIVQCSGQISNMVAVSS